jgi:DNA-directed RNA polymerase specialized sigma24 family protein
MPDGLLESIRRRDPEAFAACYEAFADDLFRYLRARCGDGALAEDLVEATFLEFVEAAPALAGGPSAVRAWLFRAGRNNFLDAVRKARRGGGPPRAAGAAPRRGPRPPPPPPPVAGGGAAPGLVRLAFPLAPPPVRARVWCTGRGTRT